MYEKEKIIITTGTFDIISREEINFLKKCKQKGDWLVVGLHTDAYIGKRLFQVMQPYETRREIVQSLKFVDEVFTFNDSDGTVCQLLKIIKICYPGAAITFLSQKDLENAPEKRIRGINFEVIK
jgi:cytidyltransferase-like protein